jgi:hypothetical protein
VSTSRVSTVERVTMKSTTFAASVAQDFMELSARQVPLSTCHSFTLNSKRLLVSACIITVFEIDSTVLSNSKWSGSMSSTYNV